MSIRDPIHGDDPIHNAESRTRRGRGQTARGCCARKGRVPGCGHGCARGRAPARVLARGCARAHIQRADLRGRTHAHDCENAAGVNATTVPSGHVLEATSIDDRGCSTTYQTIVICRRTYMTFVFLVILTVGVPHKTGSRMQEYNAGTLSSCLLPTPHPNVWC